MAFASTLALSSRDGSNGFTIPGETTRDYVGPGDPFYGQEGARP